MLKLNLIKNDLTTFNIIKIIIFSISYSLIPFYIGAIVTKLKNENTNARLHKFFLYYKALYRYSYIIISIIIILCIITYYWLPLTLLPLLNILTMMVLILFSFNINMGLTTLQFIFYLGIIYFRNFFLTYFGNFFVTYLVSCITLSVGGYLVTFGNIGLGTLINYLILTIFLRNLLYDKEMIYFNKEIFVENKIFLIISLGISLISCIIPLEIKKMIDQLKDGLSSNFVISKLLWISLLSSIFLLPNLLHYFFIIIKTLYNF